VEKISESGDTILQEQVAFDLETLRGIEEEKYAKKSSIFSGTSIILRIIVFPFLFLVLFLYLIIFPCMGE
jgi:hypothetical protein